MESSPSGAEPEPVFPTLEVDFTDDVEFTEMGCTYADELGTDHGSCTWMIVAPRYALGSFPAGSFTVLETLDDSFHCPGLGEDADALFRKSAECTWDHFNDLINLGVDKELALAALPSHVRVRFLLSLSARDLIHHLASDSLERLEVVRTINEGLRITLAEHAPTIAGLLAQSSTDGVIGRASGQEEIENQPAGGQRD